MLKKIIVFLEKYLILIGFSKMTLLGTDKTSSLPNSIFKKKPLSLDFF